MLLDECTSERADPDCQNELGGTRGELSRGKPGGHATLNINNLGTANLQNHH
jgi:hypothetical protein